MAQGRIEPADRLRLIRRRALLMMLLGLAISVVVFITAPADRGNPLGYDPMDSKAYMRQLELYGGQENVLSVQLQQWFLGLWHGRTLAYTLLFIFLVASTLYWLVAGRMELLRRVEEAAKAAPAAGN
jgi:hypothetical protein